MKKKKSEINIIQKVFKSFERKIIKKKEQQITNYGSGKRLINNISCSNTKEIDSCFKDNYIYIKNLLRRVSEKFSNNLIFKDLTKPVIGRILSLAESESQAWHTDFSPFHPFTWSDYFKISKNIGFFPLSILHFPQGGELSIIEGNSDLCKNYFECKK
jgi:hypothetical protein